MSSASKRQRFQRLLKLAEAGEAKAALALKTARAETVAAIEKRRDLSRYYDDHPMADVQTEPAVQLDNRRLFGRKLVLALAAQSQVIAQRRAQAERQEAAWRAARQQTERYQKLLSRVDTQFRTESERLERQRSDEAAVQGFVASADSAEPM